MRTTMSYIIWPALLAVSLGATQLGFALGWDKFLVLAMVYVCFAILLGVVERVMPHNPDWNLRDGQVAQDLGHTVIGSFLAPRIGDGVVVALMAAPQVWLAQQYGGGIWPAHWPLAGQIVLVVVLGDIGGYWAHRLSHEIPFLWRFHALHHSPSRLYFVNTGRFHPIDSIETTLMVAPLLILLGASEEIMLWHVAVTNFIGIMSHCNVEMRFGPLNYIFNTPGVHRWHHSRLPSEADNNYGENVMIYDLLFGTHLNPDRPPPVELGIKAEMPKGFVAQLLSPIHFTRLEEEGRQQRELENQPQEDSTASETT